MCCSDKLHFVNVAIVYAAVVAAAAASSSLLVGFPVRLIINWSKQNRENGGSSCYGWQGIQMTDQRVRGTLSLELHHLSSMGIVFYSPLVLFCSLCAKEDPLL